jgi:hypothetical protein
VSKLNFPNNNYKTGGIFFAFSLQFGTSNSIVSIFIPNSKNFSNEREEIEREEIEREEIEREEIERRKEEKRARIEKSEKREEREERRARREKSEGMRIGK